MAHDGFARAIVPAHTMADGDTIFAIATGSYTGEVNMTADRRALAAEVMADAILRAVREATGVPGYPGRPRPAPAVNVALIFLLAYTVGLTAFGVWIGRHVKVPADFFVAGRSLTWPLVGATVLAANIGAGTTVGAAGLAYRDGISAWWWNGAVGLGTLVLALWVGPKLWTLASARGHFTVGDFLEDRYGGACPRTGGGADVDRRAGDPRRRS